MFVAWRDLRFARGRFALITAVVALVSVLVGFLSGLTAGLAWQNTSGVLALPADRIVVAAPQEGAKPSLGDSAITRSRPTPGAQGAGGGSLPDRHQPRPRRRETRAQRAQWR